MPSDRNEFSRLNMPKEHAVYLSFMFSLEWNPSDDVLLQEILEPDEPLRTFTPYRRQSTQHMIRELISADFDERALHVTVIFSILPEEAELPPKRLHSKGELWSILERASSWQTQESTAVAGAVIFRFDEQETQTSAWAFPLPLPTFDDEDFPFDEIRGIHAVKFMDEGGDQIEYMAQLDNTPGEGTTLLIGFEIQDIIDKDTSTDVMRRASRVRDSFVY